MRFDLNVRVLLASLGATVVAGVVAGLLPAWRTSRVDPIESLRDGGRG